MTARQHHSTTAQQHDSMTASQHHSITALQHDSTTASQPIHFYPVEYGLNQPVSKFNKPTNLEVRRETYE
jgi:hypothetical protein